MLFKRAYVEITDICNLSCSFCPGTKRAPGMMSVDEFTRIATELRQYTEHIYLHVMGEPLLHPDLEMIIRIAGELGYNVNLTTNGTLIPSCMDVLLKSDALRKVSVSLHSFEVNTTEQSLDKIELLHRYLDGVIDLCERACCIVALRLWNEGGADGLNAEILRYLSSSLGTDIPELMSKPSPGNNGYRIRNNIYVESAQKFDWPSLSAAEREVSFCHGLTQQIAVLCDGTVVPCCLDSDGTIALGNLLTGDNMDSILKSERVRSIIEGFRRRCPSEELCRHCGYATRF